MKEGLDWIREGVHLGAICFVLGISELEMEVWIRFTAELDMRAGTIGLVLVEGR